MSEIEYNDLLFEISEKVAVSLVPRLVFMCRGKIGNEDNVRDVLTLFKELERRNYLGIDRLDTLKEILTQLRKRPLLKKVEEFERRRKARSVGIVSSLKQAASHLKGAIKFVCNFRTIAGGILVVTSGMALHSCSSLEEFVEVFNNVVLVSYTKLVEISEGSLCFTVQAETPAALKELWDTYKDGTLQRRLQEFLVTDDIKQMTNEDNIETTVFIDEEEYVMSFNFLQSQVLDEKDECRRRNSDSFLDINSNQKEITLMKMKHAEKKLSFERQVYGEEMKKLKEKIFLAREPRVPSVKHEELPGRRTRKNSDSFLYFKSNEVEVALIDLIKRADELRKEKQILESKIRELEKTLKAERASNINQTTILERPLERRRRNSDSDLYHKARKEERAFEGEAQMYPDKRTFLENYLQSIYETQSTSTKTSDSGITLRVTSEIDIRDTSGGDDKLIRNSDSDLYYEARKEEVEQTENESEEAFEGGAQMDFDKHIFVENYLQNIHETHSTTTETSDSGIRTHDATSEIEIRDISDGDHKLYLKDLGVDVIRKLEARLWGDEAARIQIFQSFGIDPRKFYHPRRAFGDIIGGLEFAEIVSMFPYTPVKLLREVFEALQLYDLIDLLEEEKPRTTTSLRPALPLQEIEKLRNPGNRPISYHSSVAVLIIDFSETSYTVGIEEFFKGLNTRSEVTVVSGGDLFERVKKAHVNSLEEIGLLESSIKAGLNQLRSTSLEVIQHWIFSQDKFSLFAVFFISNHFRFYWPSLITSLYDDILRRLVTAFPTKVKLIIHNPLFQRPREIELDEEFVVVSTFFTADDFVSSMLEIFTKRWQTMDLISMLREIKRTEAETFLKMEDYSTLRINEASTMEENLSCLVRFIIHEEPTNKLA